MLQNLSQKKILPAEFISLCAVQSILIEAAVFPKPGLVNPTDSGSHKDMNFFTFIKSAVSLTDFFKTCAEKGLNSHSPTPSLLSELRNDGKNAEKKMLYFTNGVNTHKGAIFSIGLISAAAGFLAGKNKENSFYNISETVKSIAFNLEQELKASSNETAGEKIFNKYGITGIRGEAAKGYPTAITKGIPSFKNFLSSGLDKNRALAGTLIQIMAESDDTNVISRGGIEASHYVKKEATGFISSMSIFKEDWDKILNKMNIDFKKLNISPGGSADLLAVVIFMLLLNNFEF